MKLLPWSAVFFLSAASFISISKVQAIPGCYMIDSSGQMIDLTNTICQQAPSNSSDYNSDSTESTFTEKSVEDTKPTVTPGNATETTFTEKSVEDICADEEYQAYMDRYGYDEDYEDYLERNYDGDPCES